MDNKINMDNKIISAIITAAGTIVASVTAALITKDIIHTVIIVIGCVVAITIVLLFVNKGKNKKLSAQNNELISENNRLRKIEKEYNECKEENNRLKRIEKECEKECQECKATILEVSKYLDNSHIAIPSIIRRTINEHYYLSKPADINFSEILCKVAVITNNK